MMIVIASVGAFALATLIAMLRAFAAMWLWAWFVAPLFHLPDLTMAAAIGLSLTVTTLAPSPIDSRKKTPGESGKYLSISLVSPLFSLAVGWVVKTYFLGPA